MSTVTFDDFVEYDEGVVKECRGAIRIDDFKFSDVFMLKWFEIRVKNRICSCTMPN